MRQRIGTEVCQVKALVRSFEDELALSGGTAVDQDLFYAAFYEAMHNAMEHGNRFCAERSILVETFTCSGFSLAIVEDEGQGFDYAPVPLCQVKTRRGRGLGMIRLGSDMLTQNDQGNLVAFWKQFDGARAMKLELDNAVLESEMLGPGVLLINNILLKQDGLMNHALVELLEEGAPQFPLQLLLVNCAELRGLNSLSWGVLFQFLQKDTTEMVVLFNANAAILRTASHMGLDRGFKNQRKLKVLS